MKEDVDHRALELRSFAPPVTGRPWAEPWEPVNLNSVLSGVIRQAALPAGSLILRMEELPEVKSYRGGLQLAFVQLLQFFFSGGQAAGSRVYCSVKLQHVEEQAAGSAAHNRLVRVAIQVNGPQGPVASEQYSLLQAITTQFTSCNISFTFQEGQGGGWLLLLTAIAVSGQ